MKKPDHEMEEKLYRKLGACWAGDNCVSCAVTFRKVIGIDQICKVANRPGGKGTI